MRYAVIMAGGMGKRLWPLSRSCRPKQLLPIAGGKSLLAISVERLNGLFPKENLFIITNAEYADQVRQALPDVPEENVIGEPLGRDTANAIALGAQALAGKDENATMAVFTADHVIRPERQFAETVRRACDTIDDHPNALLTFGIRPTWPHTGLGYIHCGETIADGVHRVLGFREKPDRRLARQYVEAGDYFWNSGMFVWRAETILECLNQYLPDSHERLRPVRDAVREGRDYGGILEEVYPKLQKISIDFAVMEKAENVLMAELDCEWFDVGDWPALENVTDLDEAGNVVVADHAVKLDSYRNIIVSEGDHLIAVLGMDDCIVVHSDDATLVCNRSDSQRLKELVALIEEKYGRKYV